MQVNGVASASFNVASDAVSLITLPTPIAGRKITIKRDAVSSATVRVSASAGKVIEDGPFNYVELETQGAAVSLVALDGIMWMVI